MGLSRWADYLWRIFWLGLRLRQIGNSGFFGDDNYYRHLYTTFIFSFIELPASILHADGSFAYIRRAFAPKLAFIATTQCCDTDRNCISNIREGVWLKDGSETSETLINPL